MFASLLGLRKNRLTLGLRCLELEEAHNAEIPGELDIYIGSNGYELTVVRHRKDTYHKRHEFIAESRLTQTV